jgi:hypothetical protein
MLMRSRWRRNLSLLVEWNKSYGEIGIGNESKVGERREKTREGRRLVSKLVTDE